MPATTTLEGKFLQLASGFGQGAGLLLATEEALLTALNAYRESVERRSGEWDAIALEVIEYARMMGSLAAHHALAAGRCVIDVGDVEFALGGVQTNRARPLGPCRITDSLGPIR
jgi:hypothetical protein